MSNLDKVLGNRRIKDYITRAVRLNRISHSYMIEGEKGSGKKMLAECFSRILQCEGEGELDCGVCTSCRQVDHGNHPDVIHVVHEKPNTITVNDVREQIVNTADILPYKAPYKIYIIDEAEKMNDEAQNALLKTIEEPPSYVIIFLLVTSRGAMLETIQSVREIANPDIRVLGIFMTAVESGSSLDREMIANFPLMLPDLAFKSYIRKNIDVKKAPLALQPLCYFSPRCTATQDYAALCDEMLERLEA